MQERIIQFLKESDGYLSGEEISQKLKMSRAAVWKYMQDLRSQGYEIVAVPHLGYQLVASPDKLISYEVQSDLKTKILGRQIISLETVVSTMDEAFRLGMEGAIEGTVVCAETQSKGRGRLGKLWVSPKGKGLYFSIILRPKLPPSQLAQVTLMSAVALAEAIKKVSNLKVSIKWPNDILWEGKKLAGILTELSAESDQVKFLVLGIGLNVNSTNHQIVDTGTSMKIASGGQTFERVKVLQEVLHSLEFWYLKILNHQFDDVMNAWKEQSATLKKRVRVTDPAGVLEGEAIDLDEDGALLVRRDDGVIVRKMAGEVSLLR